MMRPRMSLALVAGLLLVSGPSDMARANSQDPAMQRLIDLLVQNGVLTRDQAQSLARQASSDAGSRPPAQRGSAPRTAAKPPTAEPPATTASTEVPAGTVRVPYVPETVRKQIAADVRRELVADGTLPAQPASVAGPDGAKKAERPIGQLSDKIRIFGDLRVRAESAFFPTGNAAGAFPNFTSINNSSGFDVNGTSNAPFINVTDNRFRMRLRARLGAEVQLNDWMSMTVGAATGNDNSPVSTNQTLGGPTGNFAKYQLWLDQAFLRVRPYEDINVYLGRFPNPFWTTNLLYHDELRMDGVAAQGRLALNDKVSLFGTAGGFPFFNTAFDFGTTNTDKFDSRDKYLVAGQVGVDWQAHRDVATRFAIGYHYFTNAEGKLSAACFQPTATDSCSTDNTRPLFTQNGNTMFMLRNNLLATPTSPNLQYFGLASRYGVLDINGRVDVTSFSPYTIRLEGNFLYNTAYNSRAIASRNPVNNLSANSNTFQGGGMGYLARVTVGNMEIRKAWDWNAYLEYRYLQSDAVIDAFNESDFRLGGTNVQGYSVGGMLGVANNVAVRGRWMSGREVTGPPYRADLLQVDLVSKF